MINFSYYTNKDAPEWIKGRKEQEVREADKARNWAIGGAAGKSLIGLRELLKDMHDKKLYQLNDEGMPVWRRKSKVGFWDSIIPDKGEYEEVPYGEKAGQPTNILDTASKLAGVVTPRATGLLSYLMKSSDSGNYGLPINLTNSRNRGLTNYLTNIGKHGLPKTFADIGGKGVGDVSNASKALKFDGATALGVGGGLLGVGQGVNRILNARNTDDTTKGIIGTGTSVLSLLGIATQNPLLMLLGAGGGLFT